MRVGRIEKKALEEVLAGITQAGEPVSAPPVVDRSQPHDGAVAQLAPRDAQPLEGCSEPLHARTAEPDARSVQLGRRGAQPDALGIKELRARTKLSQSDFAALLGVELATLRNWEQGRRMPTGPARALLRAIRNDPQNVIRALARAA